MEVVVASAAGEPPPPPHAISKNGNVKTDSLNADFSFLCPFGVEFAVN